MNKNLICINCPLGCSMEVTLDDGKVTDVSGNSCNKGLVYAKTEIENPVRIVTSTVRLKGSHLDMLPVKTKEPIPKNKIFDIIEALKNIELTSPVAIGDIVVKDICGTGADVVATRSL